jgi:hypothetical protein
MDNRLANASKEQAQQAVHDGFDEAKRLLCRSARGATNLPFELATNLGDAYRKRYAMRKKMVDSEEGVPGLAQGLDRHPYVMELAAETTLSDLLELRAQTLVRGWEADIRGQTRMVGPDDKDILAPLRAQSGVGTWFRPCERTIESILRPTAHSIRSLADKVRKEGERVELALSKGFANASVIAAMHRERVVEELDTMWARHKCFQTSSSQDTKAAQASQVRLVLSEVILPPLLAHFPMRVLTTAPCLPTGTPRQLSQQQDTRGAQPTDGAAQWPEGSHLHRLCQGGAGAQAYL